MEGIQAKEKECCRVTGEGSVETGGVWDFCSCLPQDLLVFGKEELLAFIGFTKSVRQKQCSSKFQPRWRRHRQKCRAPSHNQKKDNNHIKNKEQTELPENHLHGSPTTKGLNKHPGWCTKSKNMAQMKEKNQNSRKRTKQQGDRQPIWCRVKNTGNAHRIDWVWSMKEEMKATQSEIKQNIQGTISEGKEARAQFNNLEQKEERNIQPEQNEETRNEERLSNL